MRGFQVPARLLRTRAHCSAATSACTLAKERFLFNLRAVSTRASHNVRLLTPRQHRHTYTATDQHRDTVLIVTRSTLVTRDNS